MTASLWIYAAPVALISVLLARGARGEAAFFAGSSARGKAPGLLTLTFSQVTTWIFARSLLNAAILGYFYGLPGALAYAAYYLSFLTGGWIVDAVRFRHGASSIQSFLEAKFGSAGPLAYNFVIILRLLSEVFANLLVIGILFGGEGSASYAAAVLSLSAVALGYSMVGGLRASLTTDVFQMSLFLALLALLMAGLLGAPGFEAAAVLDMGDGRGGPGWVLLAVAALQVVSYPMHDPVMMDRGFLADRKTTRASFLHAAWISVLCILAFGLLGVYAGLVRQGEEDLVATLSRVLGPGLMAAFNLALVVSALSTLDSTLSSASKLAVVDMRLARPSLLAGRIAMAVFMGAGLGLVFIGSKDLFDAVAVSGTASLFLAPVVVLTLWGRMNTTPGAYLTAFAAAMLGAALYFLEAAGHVALLAPLTGLEHKYSKLLLICIAVLAVGFTAFALGRRRPSPLR